MTFKLKRTEAAGQGIKRYCRRQMQKALDELKGRGNKDTTVHEVRKRFKKVRAAIRLIRDEVGTQVYRKENITLRDAARPLTQIRDAKVYLESLGKIQRKLASSYNHELLIGLRLSLEMNRQTVRKQVLEEQHALEQIAKLLKEASNRIRHWSFEHKGWRALQAGLERVYAKGLESFAVASADATTEHLHEWRKQAKYLWPELQILESIHRTAIRKVADRCHQLTKLLGDDHDLAMLRKKIEEIGHTAHQGWQGLLKAIDQRRQELQAAALRNGKKLYRLEPKEFIGRIKKHWKAWQRQTRIPASI